MQIWSQASQMAAQTPQERNRYVDFLRSVSILVVIVGHWLIATAYVVDGEMNAGHLLTGREDLHWPPAKTLICNRIVFLWIRRSREQPEHLGHEYVWS